MPVNWSDVKVLVALLGLVDELLECLESSGCDVRERLASLKDEITYKLGRIGREALD